MSSEDVVDFGNVRRSHPDDSLKAYARSLNVGHVVLSYFDARVDAATPNCFNTRKAQLIKRFW